jgi:ADP-ribose pyrophosphatase
MPFELIKSETPYNGKAFTIRRDTVRMPNGHDARLDIVEHPGSVVIIPIDEEKNMLFVRQYRHAARMDMLELPAGTLDKGEEPDDCALREVREETGMAAGKMEHLGSFFLAPGYSTEYMHVYLATGLHLDPLEADADEFIEVERIPIDTVYDLARRGEIPDAKTLAALIFVEQKIM